LADRNKPHTGDKATNMHLHPGTSADRDRVSEIAALARPHHLGAQALASPSYGVDVVALALAVVLAAAIALLLSQIVPQLADLIG
jgi:hypothetical protein